MENYRGLYKASLKTSRLDESKRGENRETALRQQKKKREDTFFQKRNIVEDSISPAAPAPRLEAKDTRRDKLRRWKAERERLIAQQKLHDKKKPPFKVGVAHHTLDPSKEFVPPIRATAVKCTTAKKAAAVTRADAAENRKSKPVTAAAASLASLSVPVPEAAFSGRVTRSRTAAASSLKTTTLPRKSVVDAKSKAKPASATNSVSRVNGSSKNSKTAPKLPSTRSNAVIHASSSHSVKASAQKSAATSKAVRLERQQSFAPKDHKFKAPATLTFPTTPLMLKRKGLAAKEQNWPSISGVSRLRDSPSGLSPPKLSKSEQPSTSQRRGRLSRVVKEQTPKKSFREIVQIETITVTPPRRKARSGAFTIIDVSQAEHTHVDAVDHQMLKETSQGEKSAKEERKHKKMSRKSMTEGFAVTALGVSLPEPTDTTNANNLMAKGDSAEIISSSSSAESKPEDIVVSPTSSKPITPRKSTSKKNQENLKEKENVPEDKNNGFHLGDHSNSFHEVDPIDSVILGSRRMSIHEPTPPLDITPDKLSMGMVPAQFSPYVTSARGKDKHSIQKRRNSLIPVVPDISAEELAKSNQIEHLRNLLERESSRLLTLSNLWEERQAEATPRVQDLILGPIGQARLLVKDKFQQFKRLIDKFEAGESEGKITTDDLTGFWEMMLLTVENVDKRFKELEDLRANDWQEQISEVPVKKTVAPVASKPVKAVAQSRLKAIIEAARKRKQEFKQNKSAANTSKDLTTFDGGFFKVESPKKMLPSPKVIPKSSPMAVSSKAVQSTRRSLLQHVLTNSAVRAHLSPNVSALNNSLPLSPSPKVAIAQMRASEIGKRMSMDSTNHSYTASAPSSPVTKVEPTKSILKSTVRKSLRITTPRNRVAFQVLCGSGNSLSGSPTLLSPDRTPPTANLTPTSNRIVTPGSRKRNSLIPRPIATPVQSDRPSLMPMRESLIPSQPLPGGDLIDWSSPKSDSRSVRRSRRSHFS